MELFHTSFVVGPVTALSLIDVPRSPEWLYTALLSHDLHS